MQDSSADTNAKLIFLVAQQLGELLPDLVFCGGAVTGLLISDRAAPDVLATKDVDAIIEAATYSQYSEIQSKVMQKGFPLDTSEGAPNCRHIVAGIKVDLMPIDGSAFGWSTRFYPEAVETAESKELTFGNEVLLIKVINAPMFLATKLEAWHDRGSGDYYHKDLGDSLAVIEGRLELLDELKKCDQTVLEFVSTSIADLLSKQRFIEVLDHLAADGNGERLEQLLRAIAGS